jgi:hypothetical protein
MAPAENRPLQGPQELQDDADSYQDDPDGRQDRQLVDDYANDKKDHAEDDHHGLLKALLRGKPLVPPADME